MKSLATKTKASRSGVKKTDSLRTSTVRSHDSATRTQLRNILWPHGLQTKLTIRRQGDRYEQEADVVTERVVAGLPIPEISPISTPSLQTQPIEDEEEEFIQTKEIPDRLPGVTTELESHINSLRGGGQQLTNSTRAFFEPRFGHDFSSVRIHSNSQAAPIAQALNVRAFTMGDDVVFAAGQYSPENLPGKSLLAHELTHVVQQKNKPVARWTGKTRSIYSWELSG